MGTAHEQAPNWRDEKVKRQVPDEGQGKPDQHIAAGINIPSREEVRRKRREP